MTLVAFVVVAFVATLLRFGTGRALNTADWPTGTLVVNTFGSFLLGVVHDWTAPGLTLVGVAALGSLTTFSTLVGESLDLNQRDGLVRAGSYLAVTTTAGIAAAALGLALG